MATIRQQIIDCLSEGEHTARDLSQRLSIQEKEVYRHLPHIDKTLAAKGRRLVVNPPRCLACGYVFRDRKNFSRPSRCPLCHEQRVQPPSYRVE